MSPFPSPTYTGTLITAQSEAATPNALVRRLLPEPSARLAAEDLYTDLFFPNRETRPHVLINMISSLDGKVAVSGKAGSLGSSVDRTVMRNLRARADAVMIGAGTLRAEKLTLGIPEHHARTRKSQGLKPQPLAVVATATGDVPLKENLLASAPENLLIFASSETPTEQLVTLSAHASVEIIREQGAKPERRLDLREALRVLKKRYGVNGLLVEGGPVLNHALISSGLADELFLTLAPKLLGGERSGTLTPLEGPTLTPHKTELDLISIHLSGEEVFLRYGLRPTDGSQ